MQICRNPQLHAFRNVLAYSEGTDKPGQRTANHGYDVIVGGGLFTDFSRHPRKLIRLPRYGISSTAAGRYQMIWPTWQALAKRLQLPDFSPDSQDRACDELLRECGAADLLDDGKFDQACYRANKIWASLPGSPYGQRTEKIATLRAIFKTAGGCIA
jgi:Muramidase (phage lambda lysozyme)